MNGMKSVISIDRAGRVVLPKALREQFNLHPGSQLEITTGQDHLELKPADTTPALTREGGLLIHQGAAQVSLSNFIQQTRDERTDRVSRRAGR